MTAQDHVKAIHVFTEKNPQPNVISIQLGPRAGKAEVSTRIRLADTQTGRRASAKCPTARSGPTRSTSSSRSAPAWRIRSDGRAHLINVPPKAKRGEVIEIKTLISHVMETGFRHDNRRQGDPARHHHVVRLHLQRRDDLRRRAASGDRRQSVRHVPHGGDRERHDRLQMDRRQRLRAGSLRENRGRMNRVAATGDRRRCRCCLQRLPAPRMPKSRSTSAARLTTT